MYFAILKKTIISGTARPPWWGKSTRDKFEKKKKIRRFKVPEVTLTHRKMAPLRILPRCCGKVKKPHSWGLGKWLQTFLWWVPWWFHGPWDFSEPVRSTDVFFSVRRLDWSNLVANHLPFNQWINRNAWSVELHHSKKGAKKTQPLTNRYYIYIYIPKTKNPIASMAATSNKMAAQLFRLAGAWIQSRDGKKTQGGNAADHFTRESMNIFQAKGMRGEQWNHRMLDRNETHIYLVTLPPIIMVQWKMMEKGCISNICFLSYRVIFHFHDYRRKGTHSHCNRPTIDCAQHNIGTDCCFLVAWTQLESTPKLLGSKAPSSVFPYDSPKVCPFWRITKYIPIEDSWMVSLFSFRNDGSTVTVNKMQ